MICKTRFAALIAFLIAALFGANSLLAAPAFVQSSYKCPPTPTQTIKVTFPAAQTAGNLNVVVVGWNDTSASVVSVVDANNNPYSLALTTQLTVSLSQSIYYAKNIAGSTNAVTVT